jgi:hypothetical protein
VIDPQALFARIGFLFDTDDGSLPEIRLAGLTAHQTPLVHARLRALASRTHEGASFWDRRADRATPLDSVPNAAALVVSGDAEAFHLLLHDPHVGDVALPALGVFVFPDEVVLDYRMGPEWGPTEVAALLALLCELRRLAPGSRVELDALDDVRDDFAALVAQSWDQRSAG